MKFRCLVWYLRNYFKLKIKCSYQREYQTKLTKLQVNLKRKRIPSKTLPALQSSDSMMDIKIQNDARNVTCKEHVKFRERAELTECLQQFSWGIASSSL